MTSRKPPARQSADPAPLLPDKALVPVAPRQDGWTPERQRLFIETLADTGNVTAAAQAAGMNVASAYRLRRRSDARAFDAAWEAALERVLQRLLPAAIDRALNGSVRQRWYHGEMIAEERVFDDKLLRHLLERGDKMLGAARERHLMRDNWDGGLAALGTGEPIEPAPQWKVWPGDRKGEWLTDAPPPPGYRGYEGNVGTKHYFRDMTDAENEAYARKQVRLDAARAAALDRFFERS